MTSALPLLLASMCVRGAVAFYPLNIQTFQLKHDYSGQNFFDNFDFFTGQDPTNGHVNYVDMEQANSTGLAGFMPGIPRNNTSVDPVYLGVDYTNPAATGRNSVRVSSNLTFNHALVIADILHMPTGCGTWPAYWMLGTAAEWPQAGEIDILQGVNDASVNSYTVHTNAGVELANQTMKGHIVTSNCDVNAPNQDKNAGCSILDANSTLSYGTRFNDNQGGVFATLIDSRGIRIWFFERHDIPMDIYLGSPNPPSTRLRGLNSTWGVPNAVFANPNSTFDAHFKDMKIVFNTGLCGEWAGKVWNTTGTCGTLAPTCDEYVSQNPSAFLDAYWALQSVKVYELSNTTTSRRW